MALLPPLPNGVVPGSGYWNDWYEKLRTLVNSIASGFSWSLITGTPTTLAGYGITDAQGALNNSAGLAAALSDETGTGLAVFNNTPSLTTPVIGAATGTSVALSSFVRAGGDPNATTEMGIVYDASKTSTTEGANIILRLASNANGSDTTIQFTDSVAFNSYLGAKSNTVYVIPSGTTVRLTVNTTGIVVNGDITTSSTTLHKTSASLTNGAGAGAGTLSNAPSAGNPTKWAPIDDNGTIRYIPMW